MILPEDSFVEYTPESRFSPEHEGIIPDSMEIPPMDEPSSEEQKIELDSFTRSFLNENGVLAQISHANNRNYEFRPQQLLMAQRIAKSLSDKNNLCIEAPTGIGKSFAYLIPAIKYSLQMPNPVVISTETITLQEQLIEKDLPFLKETAGLNFTAALAKGRGNYLCLRRLHLLSDDRKEQLIPNHTMLFELEKLSKWSETTSSGDFDRDGINIDASVWSMVCCEGGNCLGGRCSFFRQCFYFRARRSWEKSNIIVANHALFFTDLKIRQAEGVGAALLPNYSGVIIDEAHTLENSAADHLGLMVSELGMRFWLNRLFQPESGRGLLMHRGTHELELRHIVHDLRDQLKLFFRTFSEYVSKSGDSIRRVLQPDLFPDTISGKHSQLRRGLAELTDYLEEDDDEKEYRCELISHVARCDAYLDAIASFITMSIPESVYWIEEQNDAIQLHAAPVNVAKLLHNMLFSLPIPVILTSATLTVNRSFDYYLGRIGFTSGETLQLDSPFPPDKVKMVLVKSISDPNSEQYLEELPGKLVEAIRATQGKAFVLFTNYQQMRFCAECLRSFFNDEGIRLLVQGADLRRTAMINAFKEDIDSVLFGVDSFWTGVDIPGEALSNVIIAKLPFPQPNNPLIKARSEELEKRGLNSFMHYSLPEAVLKFRQGVGRLIRSSSDSGYIFIMDQRIISKRYGKLFIDSLPPYPIKYI